MKRSEKYSPVNDSQELPKRYLRDSSDKHIKYVCVNIRVNIQYIRVWSVYVQKYKYMCICGP